jgi:uncharacterized membrane protein
MIKYFIAFIAMAVCMMALDFAWLNLVAKGMYQHGIGHLMAAEPNVAAALVFYVVYVTGLMVFAVAPFRAQAGWRKTLTTAAMLGFLIYASYDLTNLALLRDWPVGMSLVDIAWGTLLSVAAAAVGRKILVSFPA